MNVSCPQCSTVYRVDPAKVPQGGVRARCSTCSGVIPVGMTTQAASPRQTPPRATPQRVTPQRVTPQRVTPQRPQEPVAPPPVAPSRPAPPAPFISRDARAAVPPAARPTPGAALPPLRTTPRAARPPVEAEPPAPVPVSVPPVTPPSQAIPAPTAAPAGAAASAEAPGARRPINPFLARDPGIRAKRLARALVSDMVAYYPAKHAEGLEKGTLKELFRDEIKKSYEEYVAQVGADFARSTTHFQESLNEVLGAGKRIF